jgi:hypothetical protein
MSVDDRFYERAFDELDSDSRVSVIWAKAFALSQNEEDAKRLYINYRVEQLKKQTLSDIAPMENPNKEGTPNPESGQSYYFTPSTLKIILMSLVTLGLYELYWFYKNWVLIKARLPSDDPGKRMMPFWRAFFANFWAYSLFKDIKGCADRNGIPESFAIAPLAIGYFTLIAISQIDSPIWLISLLTFAMIVPVNKVAIKINEKLCDDFVNHGEFTTWNIAGLFFGGIILIAAVSETLSPSI